MKIISKFFLLTTLLFLSFSSTVLAYEYWGPWYDHYKLIGGVSSGYYKNYATDNFLINGTYYDFRTAYENAMADWNSKTESSLSSGSADKIAMYAEDYGDLGLYGWVTMYKGYVQVQDCSTCAPTDDWDVAYSHLNAFDIEDGTPLTQSEVEGIATHELGHCLGLAHEHYEIAVMDDVDNLDNGWLDVQTDDKNGVNNLY